MTETAKGGAGEVGIPQVPLHYIRLHRMCFFTGHLPYKVIWSTSYPKTRGASQKGLFSDSRFCENIENSLSRNYDFESNQNI